MVSVLDRKLLRDLVRIWAQALAVALVLSAGVATWILSVGAYRSLDETRTAYYERNVFADVFAQATRAPRRIIDRIALVPGVAQAEGRIVQYALLDLPQLLEPASGLIVSLPDQGEGLLNRLRVRSGRLPLAGARYEVAISQSFADKHGFRPGATFEAILRGRKRALQVVGIALSPEFVYAVGPGDFVPDDRRFGILWMSQSAVEAAFDLEGAINNVTARLHRSASEAEVIRLIDDVLGPYGGRGAYGRRDQFSHAFLDAELGQLAAMQRILPPIFLVVTAFLINMILSRLITLEREQIGLLKALGYGAVAIGTHYMKLVAVIALIGCAIGFALGTWLGYLLTKMFGDFFHFPFLVFATRPDIYVTSAAVALGAALLGASHAVWGAVRLPPAVAMRPPAPPMYRKLFSGSLAQRFTPTQLTMMVGRHILRRPVRALSTSFGVSLSVAVLMTSLFGFGAVETMIDISFFQLERQDATVSFNEELPARAIYDVRALPGVLVAEPFRNVAVRLHAGHRRRTAQIVGKARHNNLSRIVDLNLDPVPLPETGMAVTEKLADLLQVRRGDLVWVELLEGTRGWAHVPVTEIFQSYMGLSVFMDIDELNALAGEGDVITGAHLSLDDAAAGSFFTVVKSTPALSSIGLLKLALTNFRATMAENIVFMTTVYSALGLIIAFGVIYNSARIQLSERGRELASLRVLGFTRGEVARVLNGELFVLSILGIPIGWALGYLLTWVLIQGFESELYRVPFVVLRSTYAYAALVVLAAFAISIAIVRRRINRLDLIEVLKTRE